jgi:hypothetical protein
MAVCHHGHEGSRVHGSCSLAPHDEGIWHQSDGIEADAAFADGEPRLHVSEGRRKEGAW